jgi:hypothetical protein
MKEEKICPHCGAKMYQYWHKLTPILVRALISFRKAVINHDRNMIHVPDEVTLSKQEYNNFQKLRFHALVAKYKEGGDHKAGYWLLTHRGNQFLNGEIQVPYAVLTYRNQVIGHGGDLVTVGEVMKEELYVQTKKDFCHEYFEDRQEKMFNMTIPKPSYY